MDQQTFQERLTDISLVLLTFGVAFDLPLVHGRFLVVTFTELLIGFVLTVALARRLAALDPWIPETRFNSPLIACLAALMISGIANPAYPGLAAKMVLRGIVVLVLYWAIHPWLAETRRVKLALGGLIAGFSTLALIGFTEIWGIELIWPLLERFREQNIGTESTAVTQVFESKTYREATQILAVGRTFRMRSVMVSPNILGYVLAWGSFFIIALMGLIERKDERWGLGLALTLILCAMTLTLSRGAFLVFVVSLAASAVAVFLRGRPSPERRLVLGGIVLCLAILFPLTIFTSSLGKRLVGISDEQAPPVVVQTAPETEPDEQRSPESLEESQETIVVNTDQRNTIAARIDLWSAAWRIFKDSPLTGAGPDSFRLLFLDTLPHKSLLIYEMTGIGRAHNILFNTAAEQGLLGLAALVWLLLAILVSSARALLSRNVSPVGWAAGCAGLLFLLGNMIDHLSDVYIYSLLFLLTLALLDQSLKTNRPPDS